MYDILDDDSLSVGEKIDKLEELQSEIKREIRKLKSTAWKCECCGKWYMNEVCTKKEETTKVKVCTKFNENGAEAEFIEREIPARYVYCPFGHRTLISESLDEVCKFFDFELGI